MIIPVDGPTASAKRYWTVRGMKLLISYAIWAGGFSIMLLLFGSEHFITRNVIVILLISVPLALLNWLRFDLLPEWKGRRQKEENGKTLP